MVVVARSSMRFFFWRGQISYQLYKVDAFKVNCEIWWRQHIQRLIFEAFAYMFMLCFCACACVRVSILQPLRRYRLQFSKECHLSHCQKITVQSYKLPHYREFLPCVTLVTDSWHSLYRIILQTRSISTPKGLFDFKGIELEQLGLKKVKSPTSQNPPPFSPLQSASISLGRGLINRRSTDSNSIFHIKIEHQLFENRIHNMKVCLQHLPHYSSLQADLDRALTDLTWTEFTHNTFMFSTDEVV
jgi:hypothetical protein